MKSNCFLYFILFCGLLFCPAPLKAESLSLAEAESFAREQGNNLLSFFAEKDIRVKYQKLDSLFLNHIDLDYIARFVVGKYWREMTPEQQTSYRELFKRYAVSVYKGFPLTFDNRISFEITGARAEGDDVFVGADIAYARASSAAEHFLVEFRMHKRDGAVRLTDIKIGESSLILSYRGRFYQMIKSADEDMGWFLEDFELATVSAEKNYALPEDDLQEPVPDEIQRP